MKVTLSSFIPVFKAPVLQNCVDSNVALEQLEGSLTKAPDTIAPSKVCKSRAKAAPAPWYNDSLKKEKAGCRKSWRKSKQEADKLVYWLALRQYLRNCNGARRLHLGSRIDEAKNSSKELFKILKDFTNPRVNNSSIPQTQQLCDDLANHFKLKIDKIYSSFNTQMEHSVVSQKYDDSTSFFLETFEAIMVDNVHSLLAHQKSGSSFDVAPPFIITTLAPALAAPIVDLCNHSLSTATFPRKWKRAQIRPILKKAKTDPLDL